MRTLPLFCTVVLVLIAGCIVGPIDEVIGNDQPVELVLENQANAPQTFEVRIVKLPATMTLHYRDGDLVNADIDQGMRNHETGPRTIEKIKYPGSSQLQGTYTLETGAINRSTIGPMPRRSALVVVVSLDEDEITSIVTLDCNDAMIQGLEVVSRSGSSGSVRTSHSCV